MGKKFFIGFFVIIIVVVASVVYVLRQKQPANQLPKFKLSVVSWVGYAPFYLAQEKGFNREEGVDVDIVTMEDTAQRKLAMAKGDVDGLGDTVDLLVLGKDEKLPSVAVMEIDVSNGADGILATNDIKSVQDLKRKKIAVQKNYVSEALLNYILQKNNLSPADVETVDMEAGAAGAAFVSGKVDVAVTFEPWLSKAKDRKGGGKVLASSADEPGVIVDVLSINENYLKNNPETVKKVMRGWFKAIAYWKSNPEEANALMAKHYNVTTQEFADMVTGLIWPDYEQNLVYFGQNRNGRIWEVAETFGDLFVKTGQVKNKPDMAPAINSDFLKTLYARE